MSRDDEPTTIIYIDDVPVREWHEAERRRARRARAVARAWLVVGAVLVAANVAIVAQAAGGQ